MYTNVPVGESKEKGKLYSSKLAPEIPRSGVKSLLRLAVTNVHFKCNSIWFVQSDGQANDASLPVIPANVCMKSFEASLQKPEPSGNISSVIKTGMVKTATRN